MVSILSDILRGRDKAYNDRQTFRQELFDQQMQAQQMQAQQMSQQQVHEQYQGMLGGVGMRTGQAFQHKNNLWDTKEPQEEKVVKFNNLTNVIEGSSEEIE